VCGGLVVVFTVFMLSCLQGENVVREIFPRKVAELNALLEVRVVYSSVDDYVQL